MKPWKLLVTFVVAIMVACGLTAIPMMASAASAPLLGVGGGNTDPAYLEASPAGKTSIRRLYYHLPGGLASAMTEIKKDQANGRVSWVSFKLDGCNWAQAATGCMDAAVKDLNTQLATLPLDKQVWVILHHEPEGDDVTTDYPKMQDRLLPLLTSPNIRKWIVFTGWHEMSFGGTYHFSDFWPKTAHVDGVGIDPYNWYGTSSNTTWDELSRYYPETKAFADSKGVAWGVAEFGLDHDAFNLTSKDGAHWIDRAYSSAASYGAAAMAYFDTALNNPANTDWRLSTLQGKEDSFLRALAASKSSPVVTSSPPVVTTPPPTATPTPTATITPTTEPTATITPTPSVTPTPTPTATCTNCPKNVRSTGITNTSVDLYWDGPNGTYEVFANGTFKASSTNAHELITGLVAGTSYTFTVRSLVSGVWYTSQPYTVKTTGGMCT